MWPIALAFGTLAFFLALAGKAKADPGKPKAFPLAPVAPGLPPAEELCSTEERTFVSNVVAAMGKGTATLDMMRKAHGIASKCFPTTAAAIKGHLDRALLAARAKAEPDPNKQLASLISSPDAPPSPVPLNPKTGKPLWLVFTPKKGKYKGQQIAKPKYTLVLNLFKKLQSLIGAEQDGALGPETLTKFRNVMTSKGFKKFPTNAASLASNTAKYIAVLSQNIPSTQVGARGGSALRSPFPGC